MQQRHFSVIRATGLTPLRDGQVAEGLILNINNMFIVASGNSNTNSWEVSTLCSAEGTPSARVVGIAGSLGVTHAAADCTSSNSGWETELMWGFCTGVFAELPLKSPQKPQEYPRRKERLNGKAVLAPTLPKEAVLLWRRALPCLPLNPFVHHLPYVMCSAAGLIGFWRELGITVTFHVFFCEFLRAEKSSSACTVWVAPL